MVCLEVYLLPSGSCRVFLQSRTGWTGGRSVWTEQFLPVTSCFHTFPLPLQREPVSTPNKCFRSSWACQPSFVNFILYNQLRYNCSGVKGHMNFTRLAVSSGKQIPVPHLWEKKKKKHKRSLQADGKERRKILVSLAFNTKFSIYHGDYLFI